MPALVPAQQEFVGMRRIIKSVALAAVLAGAAIAATSVTARAAAQDGNWSVLVITEKGECDRGYRYNVKVAGGQLRYQGDASIDLAGTVASNGAVKVSIRMGDKGASGNGRLSGDAGAGTWRGTGSNGTCAGRWEAERR
jgi:hypothetical protein